MLMQFTANSMYILNWPSREMNYFEELLSKNINFACYQKIIQLFYRSNFAEN